MTYECEICNGVNHVSRFHCEYCGTIPSRYSWLRKPIRQRTAKTLDLLTAETVSVNYTIEVHVAFGCERQSSRRAIKRTARTVPLGYYAEM